MRKIFALLFVFLVLLSLSYIFPAMAASSDDEMPREWFGKRKIVDNFGKYTRVVFIHYAVGIGDASSGVVDLRDPDGDGAADGYKLLGVRWDLSKYPNGVPYVINPTGGVKQGLSEDRIVKEIKAALESWDMAVDLDSYNYNFVNSQINSTIINKLSLYNDTPQIDYKAKASIAWPDYRNVITWGRAQPGVVAYSVIWYDSSTGEIVDADIVLNSYYKWGIADGNEATNDLSGKFDIQNIVAHEAGHWTGLDDIYDSKYWAMTMYGYAKYGEEIKRSLEPGDIAGAQAIYKT